MSFISIITTKRLLLRAPSPADWPVISYLRSDPLVNQYVKRPSAPTKEAAIDFIEHILSQIASREIYYWVITQRPLDHMIGSICLWNFSEDRKTAEIGYDLHPDFQQQGVMSESIKEILTYAKEDLNLSKIVAFTQSNNSASCRLLERHGFLLAEDEHDPTNEMNLIYGLDLL